MTPLVTLLLAGWWAITPLATATPAPATTWPATSTSERSTPGDVLPGDGRGQVATANHSARSTDDASLSLLIAPTGGITDATRPPAGEQAVASMTIAGFADEVDRLRVACALAERDHERWRAWLERLLATAGADDETVFAACRWLAQDPLATSANLHPGWLPVLQRIEPLLASRGHQLERYETVQLQAAIAGPTGPTEVRDRAELLRVDLQAQRAEHLHRVDLAWLRDTADEAERLIARFRRVHPGVREFADRADRLPELRQMHRWLDEAMQALADGKPERAASWWAKAAALDPEHPAVTARRPAIERARAPGPSSATVAPDPRQTLQSALSERWRQAEAVEDLAAARVALLELVRTGLAEPAQRLRLIEIDAELSRRAARVDDDWQTVERRWRDQDFAALRRTLNRNPALGTVPGRVRQHHEIRLLLDVHEGRIDDLAAEREERVIVAANRDRPTFVVCLLRAERAMRQQRLDLAGHWLEEASRLEPGHPLLTWPSGWLFLRRHGWKLVFLPLLLAFWLGTRALVWFLGWWEASSFTRAAWVCRRFPRLGLWSLEGWFGHVKEPARRIRLFELLVATAARLGDREKTVRYGEILRSMAADHPVAVAHLGPIYAASPASIEANLKLLIVYVAQQPADREVIARLTDHLRGRHALRPEVIPVIARHLTFNPDDRAAILYLAELYRAVPATDLDGDALDLLERAWRLGREEPAWRALAAGLLATGAFERLSLLLLEGREQAWQVEPLATIELYETSLRSWFRSWQADLGRADGDERYPLLERVQRHHYLSADVSRALTEAVAPLELDDDTRLRELAMHTREHLRFAALRTADFRRWVEELERCPAADDEPAAPPVTPTTATAPLHEAHRPTDAGPDPAGISAQPASGADRPPDGPSGAAGGWHLSAHLAAEEPPPADLGDLISALSGDMTPDANPGRTVAPSDADTGTTVPDPRRRAHDAASNRHPPATRDDHEPGGD